MLEDVKMSDLENEFKQAAQEVGEEEEFPQPDSSMPEDATPQEDDIFSGSNAGKSFDWDKAPDSMAMPERVDLNGQIVNIKKAECIIPPLSKPWIPSKYDKNKLFKPCSFKIHMESDDGTFQIENYSGARVFKAPDGKYSFPTIWKTGTSQLAELMQQYAKFKGVDVNQVTLKDFGKALDSGLLRGKIESKEFKNPETNTVVAKNIIVELLPSQ